MSGPIQARAPGYLGLLELKNLGKLPDVAVDSLQPIFEMRDMYLRGSAQWYQTALSRTDGAATYNSFGPYAGNPLVVPDGQWWWVEYMAVRFFAAGAGATLQQGAAAMQGPGGINPFTIWEPVSVTAAQTAAVSVARNFWAPAGSRLGVWLGVVGVANITSELVGLRYTPLVA